jgi:hypothetical protein
MDHEGHDLVGGEHEDGSEYDHDEHRDGADGRFLPGGPSDLPGLGFDLAEIFDRRKFSHAILEIPYKLLANQYVIPFSNRFVSWRAARGSGTVLSGNALF